MNRLFQQRPDKAIPEIELLDETDWLLATKEGKFGAEADIRQTLSRKRQTVDAAPPNKKLSTWPEAQRCRCDSHED
jgi:hypothetical protein